MEVPSWDYGQGGEKEVLSAFCKSNKCLCNGLWQHAPIVCTVYACLFPGSTLQCYPYSMKETLPLHHGSRYGHWITALKPFFPLQWWLQYTWNQKLIVQRSEWMWQSFSRLHTFSGIVFEKDTLNSILFGLHLKSPPPIPLKMPLLFPAAPAFICNLPSIQEWLWC